MSNRDELIKAIGDEVADLTARGGALPAHVQALWDKFSVDYFATTTRTRATSAVNKYQTELEKAYADWAEETAGKLADAPEGKREAILAAALLLLLALLKRLGRENIPDAAALALSGAELDADEIISDALDENDDYLTTSLIPDLKAKVKSGLGDAGILAAIAAGAGAEAIGALFQTETARVGSYSSAWWKVYNRTTGESAKAQDKKVTVYLDPQANHCGDCPQFATVEGKEYASWDAYQTATGGRVPGDFECGPSCRCIATVG